MHQGQDVLELDLTEPLLRNCLGRGPSFPATITGVLQWLGRFEALQA
jgi:hypothetical protein